MAREIRGVSTTGTLYARIMNSAGLWWNGTTFEAYTAANYGNYDVAMTEQGDSGVYVADFPSGITTSGTYEYFVHRQAGGSPAEGDLVANTGKVDWTGNAVVTASAGAMTGSDFYDYVLRKGFTRTDKSATVYEAITDAVQEMRRRFMFDEAEADTTTTDTISSLGDFKLAIETDQGMILDILLQDGTNASQLDKISKDKYDELYPWNAVDSNARGYPEHYCIYAEQIYIGPIPDSVSYTYRINYSKRAGTVSSTTAGVPFTNLYRDVLSDLVHALLYESLDEFDKAEFYRNKFEAGFALATRRERVNSGVGTFAVRNVDC